LIFSKKLYQERWCEHTPLLAAGYTSAILILNQVLSNLKLFIIENNATVSHGSLPEVMADSIQLVQIFQNLIINGIKFHSGEAPKIHISAEEIANEWLFSVQDNGIGIDP